MRRIRALLTGLPIDAAVFRADTGGWSSETHLLAMLTEIAWETTRAIYASAPGRRKGAKLPDPLRLPRPGQEQTPSVSIGELARRVAGKGL